VTADGVSVATVSVTLNDYSGNPVSGKIVSLSAGSGTSTVSPSSGTSSASGVVSFTVKDTKAETVTYTATDTTDNFQITQTVAVSFTPGTPSSTASTVSVAPASLLADGTTLSTITVTLRDANGNLVPGKIVSLVPGSGNSVVSPSTGTSNSSGQAVFTVKDGVPEVMVYTARDVTDSVNITQTGTVTFTVGPVSAQQSTLATTPNSIPADGGSVSTVTVVLKDAYGHAISGKTVTLTQGTGHSVISPASGPSTSTGTVTFTVTNTTGETVTYAATDASDSIALTQTASVGFVPVTAAPTLSPAPGIYSPGQSVTLTSSTPGAAIRYTTDGQMPSETFGTFYTGPFIVNLPTTIRAIAYQNAWIDSSVSTGSYTIIAAQPVMTPAGGTYSTTQNVSITTTSNAAIYYTTDGSTPSVANGSLYSGPVAVTRSETLKAVATGNGWADSPPAIAAYTINGPVATPTFAPVAGTYSSTQTVTISTSTPGATIRYTTNGDTPNSTTGTVYTAPISVTSNQTIQAIAYENAWLDSLVASAAYTINEIISTPSVNGPATGLAGSAYAFTAAGAVSTVGHSVEYQFTWGNGTTSAWLPAGTTTASTTWSTPGTYNVTLQARCSLDHTILSAPSVALVVSVVAPPTITTLSSTSGSVGMGVTITGSGFGTTVGTVSFAGVNAPVYSWTNNAVLTAVPTGAGNGNVVVTAGGISSNGVMFNVVSAGVLSTMDSSANANNGTANNGVAATAGWIGGGTQYSGTNTYIDLGSSSSLMPAGAMTASAWIKAAATQVNFPQVLSSGDSTGLTGYNLYLWSQGYPSFIVKEANNAWGNCFVHGPNLVNDGSWHLITGVYLGTAVSIYVDGVFAASSPCSNQTVNYGANARGQIGWKLDAGANDNFNGVIDEVHLAGISRSADWITTEFKNQSAPGSFEAPGSLQAQNVPVPFTVTGQVTNSQGASPLTGVLMTLSNGANGSVTTNNGSYAFGGLMPGVYTITPSLTGATFTPNSTTVTVTSSSISNVNFTATGTYSITGQLTFNSAAMSGVGVTLSGGPTGSATATATTNASGNYTFPNLFAGSYYVTPAQTGYDFAGPVAVNAPAQNVNFTASLKAYTISGTVTNSGTAVPGLSVNITGGSLGGSTYTTTTNSYGYYTFPPNVGGGFPALNAGTYTVWVQAYGSLTYSPGTYTITLPSIGASNVNFTAASGISETVTSSPVPGVQLSINGSTCTSPCTGTWVLGNVYEIAAPSPQTINGVQYVFSNWSDGGAPDHTVTAGNVPGTLTANFIAQYQITTTVSPSGAGAVVLNPPSTGGWYNAGTSVQLTASPAPGYQFSQFSGFSSGTANPLTLTVSGAISETATFTTLPPVPTITDISPTSAPVTTDVTLQGVHFGTTQGTVTFNQTAGAIKTWTDTSIVATVPASISAGTVTITVVAPGVNLNSSLTVSPFVASLAPTILTVGQSVTISGTGFGPPLSGNVVYFNGTVLPSSVSNWAADGTSITVTVPNLTQSGYVSVFVNNVMSNSVGFTLAGAATYTISGHITTGGCPLSGVTVGLSGYPNVSTDANGAYSFNNIPGLATYTLTAVKTGYSFDASPMTFTNLSSNRTGDLAATGPSIPAKEYIRLGSRVIAVANCASQ